MPWANIQVFYFKMIIVLAVARTTGSYMEILVTEENEVIPCFLNSGPA
jgi:hypothetical protein